jgi:hypothetical protein
MMVEATVACAGALVLGLLNFDYRRYRYWWHWSRRGVFVGSICAQALLYALSGLVAYFLAMQTRWEPAKHDAVLNGIAFAVVGQALLRIQFDAFNLEKVKDPTTIVRKVLTWIADMLDTNSGDHVMERITDLADDELIERAFDIFWAEIDADAEISDAVKLEILRNLERGQREIEDGTNPREGRGRLRGFCINAIKRRELL